MLGGMVTRQLLEKGKTVRILVRENSASERLAHQGLATSALGLISAGAHRSNGDLKNPASLREACAGIHTVIATANSAMRGGEDNAETVEKQGNRALIEAAKEARVRHFIFISTNIADANSPIPFLAGKGQAERALQASGMPYTILAPNAFMDTWIFMLVGLPVMNGQPVLVVGSGARKHSFIAMADVAAFVQACVDNPQAFNQKLYLGGPGALSFREAAEVYARVLRRPVEVQSVPPGEPLPNLSAGATAMAASFDSFDSQIEMNETAARFGVKLTSLESFVRQTTRL